MNDYTMTGDQWDALRAHMTADDANLGEDLALPCNVEPGEHVHARRVGRAGIGSQGRVAIMTHGEDGGATIYVAGAQARILAAHLLNAADALDGTTPLAFLPRFPDEPEPLDVIDAEVIEDEDDAFPVVEPATPSLGRLLGDLASLPAALIVRRLLK